MVAGAGLRELRLEVREFRNLTRWRWVLTDDSGTLVADHDVQLDPGCWQFEAFADLTGYLSWHAAPDRRGADEARIVSAVGEWIGSSLLGPVAAALIRLAERQPVTVRVVVPPGADALLAQPLELAHVAGKPLAVQDVTFVMQPGSDDVATVAPVGDRLRVLGLFSMPEGGRSLNLRRERYSLVQLIQGIAAAGKAADVRVLQYGVTRERLRDVLEEAEGWDVIHVSGHGAPGELLLETAAGGQDRVPAAELADLLDLARPQVKLVTMAVCWSAAVAADEQRRVLGLPVPDDGSPERIRGSRDAGAASGAATVSETLATQLVGRLGCAVLAMRYPVGDEFAMALTWNLYDLLARHGQPLSRAVGMTLRQLSSVADGSADAGGGSGSTTAFSALSVATPALFGGVAASLRLAAPERREPENYDTATLKMAGFPPQPERFVGRTGVMARASAALAARSGIPGVLLHGMPGGGKTACALELAYGHEHAFDRLVWYKAPDEGMAVDGAITDFAITLERYLDGFQMVDALASADRLAGFLPRLAELLERRRVLIVIDNAESLLTEGGSWCDERWGAVIGALCGHKGLGRVVLTSRRMASDVAARLRVEAVDALSADEALLLARELPHLRKLMAGQVSGIKSSVARRLARHALEVAKGHPKLLGLADGQAAHPERLAQLVAAGGQAWRKLGGLPEGFFATNQATASGADYLNVLVAWTKEVADTLSPGERDLFWFLCCLEESDRIRSVLNGNWAGLLRRLGRDGQRSDLDQALAVIAARDLAAIQPQADDADESYPVHPGVAEAGRAHAGGHFQDAVDAEAAAYWGTAYRDASAEASDGSVDTGLLVRAGLAAVPYLIRRHQWTDAAALLEGAFAQDPSRANATAALPAIQQIARHEPRQAGVLARVLQVIDLAAGETELRAALDAATDRGDYRTAWVSAGRLVYLCLESGRLAEALAFAGQKADYARQAGLGPWTQLLDEAQRLQVVTAMGHASQVLAEVHRHRDHMPALPATPGPDEAAQPWDVRETLLEVGRYAAALLDRWDDALGLNAEVIASLRDRRASATNIARARFGDYYPLLRLGRADEALGLLLDCRQAFQDAHDTRMLGNTLTALADTEDERGHGDAAIRLERDALRYKYLTRDVTNITVSYHNLGGYLHDHARQPAPALASHLAAALINALAGIGDADADSTDDSVRFAATDLRALGTAAILPGDVADLAHQIGDIPGTDLPGLITRLSADPETAEQTLRNLIALAQELAAASPGDLLAFAPVPMSPRFAYLAASKACLATRR